MSVMVLTPRSPRYYYGVIEADGVEDGGSELMMDFCVFFPGLACALVNHVQQHTVAPSHASV